jgi:hypothetical protein
MNTTVPLGEALPWSSGLPRNILICDTVESDGRFVLHTMATQALKTNNCKLFWLACGPVTDRQIATALRKIGCDVAASYLRDTTASNKSLKIKSLSNEIAAGVLSSNTFDPQVWLRELYQEIKTWVKSENDGSRVPCWLFLDDISSLGTLLGESLVFSFLDSLLSLASSSVDEGFGVAVRCSHDLDYALSKRAKEEGNDNSGWLGEGGVAHKQNLARHQSEWIPWERCIESQMDAIVDVLPLTSGYSREAHGRLIFSECPTGRGWGVESKTIVNPGARWNEFLINYCLNDNGVRAIRLRATN